MATQSPLLTDPSKINPAGAEPSDIQDYQQAIKDSLKALESRYSEPNWYKVAAGFAKPQLGGFLASLGSASEAMGENLEQQREQQLPISQLRAQLAQSKIAMTQNQKAADLLANHKGPVDENLVSQLVSLAPEAPSTKAAQLQLETFLKNRAASQQNIALAQSLKMPPNQADLEMAGLGKKTKAPTSNAPEDNKSIQAPSDLTKVEKGAKLNFGLMPVDDEKMAIPTYAKNIQENQTMAEQKLQTIKSLGDEEHYAQLHNPLDQMINFVEDKSGNGRKMLGKVVNTIQTDSKLQTAALAAINEGVHASFAGNSIQAGAPVQTFLDYYKDPKERAVAQMVVQALIAHNYAKNQIRGGMKGNLPASEADVITGGGLTNLLNPKTLMHELYQTDNQLEMYHSLHNDILKIKRDHPDVLSSHAPDYQILNSEWYKNKTKEFTDIAKDISKNYNQSLLGGK
jgi:hypothetical protein